MDDTNLAYLCDEKMRAAAQARGDDPNELPHRYATFINRVVAKKPAGMTLAVHLCRGNFQSTWAAQGGYEPVAEALLSEMKVDAYFLEYDDKRSGDFKPLRFLPKGKIVVLGLVTTKLDQLEKKDDLKRRIDEAAKSTCRSNSSRSARSAASRAPCMATRSPSMRNAPSCAW
jgi:5-methyltetrahydropteroyltriglutamate--homocysteine methyltransferase